MGELEDLKITLATHQIRQKKIKLDKDIKDLVDKFNEETGMTVCGIDIESMKALDGATRAFINCQVGFL